ncbi:MAG: ATP-binding protein, partial [Ferruginibacter sp.]
ESFAYSISHDLRAPLRGIVGFTSILDEEYNDKLDTEGKRLISVIKNNTLKMGNLIDDLLAFSRLGRNEITKTQIDTNAMVEEVVTNANSKTNTIWEIDDFPYIKGDVNTLRQVWINLISNAVKYSRNREQPHIRIGVNRQENQTIFFIKDNGVGFNQQYEAKLFKVFQRLHNEREFEGTGVGLAIVEKIISKHGGKIWAEAEEGKGASFFFSIPDDFNTNNI